MSKGNSTLSEEELDNKLSHLEGWTRKGKFIQKEFVFSDFKEINHFLPYLTKTIVEQNHHPDFEFDSGARMVSIRVMTHSKGGITQNDLNLARSLNNWRNS